MQFGGSVTDIKFGIQSFDGVVIQHHSFKQLVLLGLLVVNIGTQARKGVVDGNRVQPDLFKTVFVAGGNLFGNAAQPGNVVWRDPRRQASENKAAAAMVGNVRAPDVADRIENFVLAVFYYRNHVFNGADSQIVVNVGQFFDIFVEMKGKKHKFGRRQGINGLRHDVQAFDFIFGFFQVASAENRGLDLSEIGNQNAVVDGVEFVDNFALVEGYVCFVVRIVKDGDGNVVVAGIVQHLRKSFRNFVNQQAVGVNVHLFFEIIAQNAA